MEAAVKAANRTRNGFPVREALIAAMPLLYEQFEEEVRERLEPLLGTLRALASGPTHEPESLASALQLLDQTQGDAFDALAAFDSTLPTLKETE